MKLACRICQVIIPDANDGLCPHRSPTCWSCCADTHPWQPENDAPEGTAA